MKQKALTILLAMAILAPTSVSRAQPSGQEDNGIFILGSVLLSVLHVPFKLATCAATQATAAVFYAGTFGVPGHYEGGTSGKDIGETARRSCTGDWFITPDHVKRDYGR